MSDTPNPSPQQPSGSSSGRSSEHTDALVGQILEAIKEFTVAASRIEAAVAAIDQQRNLAVSEVKTKQVEALSSINQALDYALGRLQKATPDHSREGYSSSDQRIR